MRARAQTNKKYKTPYKKGEKEKPHPEGTAKRPGTPGSNFILASLPPQILFLASGFPMLGKGPRPRSECLRLLYHRTCKIANRNCEILSFFHKRKKFTAWRCGHKESTWNGPRGPHPGGALLVLPREDIPGIPEIPKRKHLFRTSWTGMWWGTPGT